MRCAALNSGSEIHMLDHIAPLAELMQMPLITTEEKNFELARKFYPQIEVRLMPDLEFRLGEIAAEFDALFESKFWGAHLKSLFQQLYKKEMRLVYCPHGQSDKGYRSHSLAQYALQDTVLHYGGLMVEMLQELNIPSPQYAIVGNYRLHFYQKYRSFYDSLLSFDRKKRTLLYAPTWQDLESSTSFFTYGAKVLSELPSDWNLILKLHPLLEERNPSQFYPIAKLAAQKPNAFLIEDFPPVYPLLSQADVYLGDSSSIGYDFLSFQKPLYFFPTNHPTRLHACGTSIDPNRNLYAQLEAATPHLDKQKILYDHAFHPVEDVRQAVLSLFHKTVLS